MLSTLRLPLHPLLGSSLGVSHHAFSPASAPASHARLLAAQLPRSLRLGATLAHTRTTATPTHGTRHTARHTHASAAHTYDVRQFLLSHHHYMCSTICERLPAHGLTAHSQGKKPGQSPGSSRDFASRKGVRRVICIHARRFAGCFAPCECPCKKAVRRVRSTW